MKKTLVNLSLEDDEIAILDAMAGKALNRQAVARMLLIAALEAVQRNQGRLHLPPRFEIGDLPPVRFGNLNEPSTKPRK
jgi:hypothetical protein